MRNGHAFRGLANDGSHAPHTDCCTLCGLARAAHNARGFRGVVTIHSEGWLLGGTKRHESIMFASEDDAANWAEGCAKVNKNRAGYTDADIRWTVETVKTKA